MGKKKSNSEATSKRRRSTTKSAGKSRKPARSANGPSRHGRSPASDRKSDEGFPIVGIGASAGGLAALKKFFSQVLEASGLAYVVVMHLSPEYKSHLAELLQPHVAMPVAQVSDTVPLEPDHVYVIPPNANLDTIDTHLRLTALEERRRERAPIDHFFRTLAKTHSSDAVAVILSGTGADGTLGIREIKELGGLCIAQSPSDAEYDGMPQSAIATGLVDLVLPVVQIPGAILRFAKTEPRLPEPAEGESVESETRRLLHKVFTQIRTRTARDFSRYKLSTILRRIQRRMQLRHVVELSAYVELLRDQPDEVAQLADDLLITVTNFFRDPEAFATLEKRAIPELFRDRGPEDSIRVWSVGCATGEEAYSLAMLLLDEAAKHEAPPRLQVFASDLHEPSLVRARDGFYSGDIETDVSSPRLRRYLRKEDGGYRICKEVREIVVFAPHNLLGDPPFSRLDLVSCRNLLIYLQRDAQRDVAELFHYALRPGGWLWLGSSETVQAGDLFRLQNKKACLYRKLDVPGPEPRLPVFPLTHTRQQPGADQVDWASEPISFGTLHARMVEQHAPPSMLISADDQLVHLSEHAGRYLVHPGGEPTTAALKLVRDELRVELRTLLHVVRQHGSPASSSPIRVQFNGESAPVVLHASPGRKSRLDGFVLVIFDERAPDTDEQRRVHAGPRSISASDASPSDESEEGRVRKLENELALTRQRLQAIIEEYETTQEEMRASNEEMQSTNEELRSTMEELETSKEELQSMNEELQTVNQENRHKVEELAQLSGDLQNLLASTGIATLFLDRQLRILRFTPRVRELFNVRQTDRGRPIGDFTHRLGYDSLAEDAQSVLDTLALEQREIEDQGGRWYLARILPYRSAEDRIEGVVITFTEITSRMQAERALRESERALRLQLKASQRFHELGVSLTDAEDRQAIFEQILDIAMSIVDADCASMQLREGGPSETPQPGTLRLVAHRGFEPESARYWESVAVDSTSACGLVLLKGERVIIEDVESSRDIRGRDLDELRRCGIRAVQTTPLYSRSGQLLGAISTHWRQPTRPSDAQLEMFDVVASRTGELIERAAIDEELRLAKKYAESIVETLHEPLLVLHPDLTVCSCNPAFYKDFQVSPEDTTGRKIFELGNGQWDIPELRRLLEDVLPDSNVFNDYEVIHEFETIGRRVMLLNARRLDHVQLILLGIRDITARVEAEEAIRQLNATLETQVAERTSALAMLRDVAAMANETNSVEVVIEQTLRRFCEHNGWSCGYAWLPCDDAPDQLIVAYHWHSDQASGCARLSGHQAKLRIRRGEDVVGRVFASGEPIFTNDLIPYLSAHQLDDSDLGGMQTACAFPIRCEEHVVGVLEFFSASQIESSQEMRDAMVSVGTMLGRVVERARAHQDLQRQEARLRAVLTGVPDAIIAIDYQGTITDVNPATERTFGYSAAELLGQQIDLLMPEPYRDEHRDYLERYLATREPHVIGTPRELQARRKDGELFPIELAVTEITELDTFVGLVRDISERKLLAKQVIDATADEQRRIGADIHDGVGQELSGLRYMAQTHFESLARQNSPDAPIAERMVGWLTTVQTQLRNIIRQLIPVEVDREGLVAALRGLAKQVAEVHQIRCEFTCRQPISMDDPSVAGQLYRIAQEAVRNAVRHAQASHITISLSDDDSGLRLEVADDGMGIEQRARTRSGGGIGLRSMEYRAGLIGAQLEIQSKPQGGTCVVCSVLRGGGGRKWVGCHNR